MKENSIKENIEKVENYLENSAINDTDSNFFKNGGWETVDLEIPKAMQHILSDYKRVLKENEKLKESNKIVSDLHCDECILKQIIKDKIENLKKVKERNIKRDFDTVYKDGYFTGEIDALQELLESEE